MATTTITDELVTALTAAVTVATGRAARLDPGWRPPVQGAVGHLLGMRLEAEHAPLVVKLFPPAARDRAVTEARAIATAGLPGGIVPRVRTEGRLPGGTSFLLMSRLPGDRWADRRPALTTAERASVVAQVGVLARRLHAVTDDRFGPFAGGGGVHPSLTDWTRALVEGTVATFRAAGGPDDLASGVERLAAATVLDDAVPPAFCHQDLNGGNILLSSDPGGPPRISGVVDFERAEWADPVHDLALTVIHLMHEGEEGLVSTLLEAYGGLDDAAQSRLTLHVVLRMASEWAWVITDRPADWRPKTATLAAWIGDRT
ncbi:phosphotransferase family protein [Tersicoccus sp. Bi-70]|uniref:phosphotransferase family protein n=1 Tax=Tersicoccus sp. Bi-70 TaxID=1897634 RepID=UPI0009773FEF|nr:aminoglycoside phosphotransferase family protein [Tersicoccus sp. Bi-70]OMH34217.1 hypothetical protein BGP79_03530 [Tersicoccus sp. Bi-70]